MLTGKCKEAFEKWNSENNYGVYNFEDFNLSMQYGVLVDFFDSVGISIEVVYFTRNIMGYIINHNTESYPCPIQKEIGNLQKSRTEAIKKANELFNKEKP